MNKVNHSFFDGASHSDWLAGLLAADGSVSAKMDYWTISQSGPHGLDLIREVRDMVGSSARIATHTTTHQDAHKLHVTSSTMCHDLYNIYDVRPRKTYDYRGPYNTVRISAAFVRGYIEGDGSVGVYKSGATDRNLTISVVGTPEFMSRVAIAAPVHPRTTEIGRCQNLSELRWSGSKAFDLGNWAFMDDRLPRGKKARLFLEYLDEVYDNPPQWLRSRAQQDELVRYSLNGHSKAESCRLSGLGHSGYKILRNYEKGNYENR